VSPRILVTAEPDAPAQIRRAHTIAKQLKARGAIVAVRTPQSEAATVKLLDRAQSEGLDVVAVAGDDAAVGRMVGLLQGSNVMLGVAPTGPSCLIAHSLELPTLTGDLVDLLLSRRCRDMWAARANEEIFVSSCSVGFEAEVVHRTPLWLLRWLGWFAFLIMALLHAITYRQTRFQAMVDGKDFKAAGVIITTGPYYAGKLRVARHATPFDRRLHVCLLQRTRRRDLLRYLWKLKFGGFDGASGVLHLNALEVDIRPLQGYAPAAIQIDGRPMGYGDLHVSLCDSPVRVKSGAR
jgi:diacylglycerol kinase (ATP)